LESRASVEAVCEVLRVSRSGYFAWRSRRPSARALRDEELLPLVREIFWTHKRRYGARRIAHELRHRGEVCSVARASRLLKSQRLRAIGPKSYKPRTTQSRHTLGYNSNLLRGRSAPVRTNEVWVADITYIPLAGGSGGRSFGYLSIVMDLYSRMIVGWSYGESMTEELVIGSLKHAITSRQPPPGLIHHSDRGGQYASASYRAILRRAEAQQSMNEAENCYDNVFMESCFGTIKTELERIEFADSRAAIRELAEYISYYNVSRRHSSLGYLTPTEFENHHTDQPHPD
jgi:transposase InsO family protein